MRTVVVKAKWDDEARVWVATSKHVPGLIVEASTTDELEAELKAAIPLLLSLNDGNGESEQISINLKQESKFFAAIA